MKNDFIKGMGSITLYPKIPEVKPITTADAFSNVQKSFSAVAKTMNSVLSAEKQGKDYAKAK